MSVFLSVANGREWSRSWQCVRLSNCLFLCLSLSVCVSVCLPPSLLSSLHLLLASGSLHVCV